MSESQPPALPRLSRVTLLELAFWAVVATVCLVALVRAFTQDDGERIVFAGVLLLNAGVWLVRTWWSRPNGSGAVASPPHALAPPRLWVAGGILLVVGLAALFAGPARLGWALLGLAVLFVLPLAMEDRRRRR